MKAPEAAATVVGFAGVLAYLLILAAIAPDPRPAQDATSAVQSAADDTARPPEQTEAPSDRAGASPSLAVVGLISSPPPAATPRPTSAPRRHDTVRVATGTATWYDDGPGLYGAVPGWHYGQRPYRARVCRGHRCATITVRDFCACGGDRIVDLSPAAFRSLGLPLSRGLATVTLEVLR